MDARAKVWDKQKFRKLVAAKKIKGSHKTGNAHQFSAQLLVGGRVAPQGLKFLKRFVGSWVVVAELVKIEFVKNLGRVPRGGNKIFPRDFSIFPTFFGIFGLG